MPSRFLLALTLIIASFCSINANEPSARLGWANQKIQITIQRQNSDAAIPTGISIRKSTDEMAVVGDDHLVRIKNRKTGELVRIFETHSDWVKVAKFHPDSKTLFTAGADRKIVVWNADNHHDYHRFATENRSISDLEIDQTGRFIATVGFDSTLNIYEIESGKKIHSLDCPSQDMRAIAINAQQKIAVGGRNGIIRVFDIVTGKKITDMHPHQKRIRDLIFTDDSTIVSCSDDLTVQVSDLVSSSSKQLLKVSAKLHSIADLGGGQLAVGASDNMIRIASITQMREIGFLKGHTGTVCALEVDGKTLISGSFDTQIRIWTIDDSFVKKTPSSDPTASSDLAIKSPISDSPVTLSTPSFQSQNSGASGFQPTSFSATASSIDSSQRSPAKQPPSPRIADRSTSRVVSPSYQPNSNLLAKPGSTGFKPASRQPFNSNTGFSPTQSSSNFSPSVGFAATK